MTTEDIKCTEDCRCDPATIPFDSNQAKKMIEQESKRRSNQCAHELQELMSRYNCFIDPVVIIRSGKAPEVMLNITAK